MGKMYEKHWKDRLSNIEEDTKKELKELIDNYEELNSIIYTYFWIRETNNSDVFFEPVTAESRSGAHVLGDTNLVRLQNMFKESVTYLERKSKKIKSVILPLNSYAYGVLDKSITSKEDLPSKYGDSFVMFSQQKDNQFHVHSTNFDYVCTKVLNVDFEVVERPMFAQIVATF